MLAMLLTFVVAKPIWASDGVGYGGDLQFHAYRIAEMHNSWAQGEFFPSWAESTYWGYGSPIFHFYASLTYHIASATQLVLNVGVILAIRWLMLFSFMLAGVGMFLFCRRRSGALGALIGGLIYVNSPYLLLTNTYYRGVIPELFALGLLPIMLWRIDALRDAPNARNFLLVMLLEVALINTHNLSAAFFTGIVFAWLGFEALVQRVNRETSQLDIRGEVWAALALLFGVLAAASFWFPVLQEGHTVSLEFLIKDRHISHWRSLGELLEIPDQFYTIVRPDLVESLHIGIAQWTFALAGAGGSLALYVRGFRSRHPNAFLAALFFFGLSMALLAVSLPWARSLWESFRPLGYLQFPLRLLGPIALCCAYLASLNGFWLRRLPDRVGQLAMALAVAAVVVAGFALSRTVVLSNQNLKVEAKRQVTNIILYSATADNEFLPATASLDVDKTRLQANYADGYPIDRFDHESLPAGASATLLHSGPEAHTWRISSPTPFEATILKYWWLGWTATVDGQPVPVAPSDALGLINVSLPAGDYTLRVYLGSTPARDIGALISALALIAGLALAWRLRRLGIAPRPYAVSLPMKAGEIRGVLLGAAIIAVCFYIVFF